MNVLITIAALLQIPAIILGLIAFIGLILQKKSASDTISGTVKTVLSLLIIGGGAGILIAALGPIQKMFEIGFGASDLKTFVTFDEAVVSAVQSANVDGIGAQIGWTLLIGYAFHLLLARITPFKYIYLTGHMIWIHAGAFTIVYGSLGLNTPLTVALASLTFGAYLTLAPAIAQPFMRRITGGDTIAFGHGQTLLNVLAAGVGKLVGGKSKSTEEMKVPEKLNFFRDIAISTTIVMLVVVYTAAGLAIFQVGVDGLGEALGDSTGGQGWFVFAFLQAMGFVAGMLVLLYGVRMMIAEIVPAFQGIGERLIPGARPALDVPVIFAFAPNALLIGLVTGLIGQVVGMVVLGLIGWPIPLPSIIIAFFASGAGAIFGNSTGGRRGAVAGGFLWGFLGWLMISFAYKFQVFGDLEALGAPSLGFSVPDGIVPAIIIDLIGKVFGA